MQQPSLATGERAEDLSPRWRTPTGGMEVHWNGWPIEGYMMHTERFWQGVADLLASSEIVIDRPRGSRHPRYPDCIYPLDYGYLAGTQSGDGNEIDVWIGSLPERSLTAVICCYDALKRDMEVKLLLGCTPHEVEQVMQFQNSDMLSAITLPGVPG
jgi:inorganic pyrophosphatase